MSGSGRSDRSGSIAYGAETLERLRSELAGEGGLLAGSLSRPAEEDVAPFAALVAEGPRTRRAPDEYALLVESILEGYLVHYGRGRAVSSDDSDLRLLTGDFLYAAGLARLARLGDLEAVAELADLIGLCARVHAASDDRAGSEPWHLTGPLWGLSTLAVGLGGWAEHAEAKQAVRENRFDAAARVADAAAERAESAGLGQELRHALIAFGQTVERPLSIT